MDQGRWEDLRELKDIRDDPENPLVARRNASLTFDKILSQLRDKELTEQRHRLSKARAAGDTKAADKIGAYIKHRWGEHEKRKWRT